MKFEHLSRELKRIVNDLDHHCDELRKELTCPDRLEKVYSLVHTLKGTTGYFEANDLFNFLEAFEESVYEVVSNQQPLTVGHVEDWQRRCHQLKSFRLGEEGPSSLTGALENIVHQAATDAGKKIVFQVLGDPSDLDPEVTAALFRCLVHLVRNAVDHGVANGGTLTLQFERKGHFSQVTFSDDGEGIDLAAIAMSTGEALTEAEALNRIFDPGFSTLAHRGAHSGRGVGLSTVKAILEDFGGRIHVTTVKGQGASFVLTLPISVNVNKAS